MVSGTLVSVSMFSVMWSEFLIPSAISSHQCVSVRVEYAFTSPVRTAYGMFVMCCMQFCISVSTICSVWLCCLVIYKCLQS